MISEKTGILKNICLSLYRSSKNHGREVGELAYNFSSYLELPEQECNINRLAGLYHDIGKSKIDPSIVNKPSSLTATEFEVMKQHVILSESLLSKKKIKTIPKNILKEIQKAVAEHHENFCGSGYPKGLKGDEIALSARILRICDTFIALTRKRPYKPAIPFTEALRIMRNSIEFFDYSLFMAFEQMIYKNYELISKKERVG